jgi:retron-type reverse transcriptase
MRRQAKEIYAARMTEVARRDSSCPPASIVVASRRIDERLGDNLLQTLESHGSGSYFPPPMKAVPIPKKSGGTRMLGVPTVADRVA